MTALRPPEFWIVAGPNGAGKTTCVQKEPISNLLPAVRFLNPDDFTLTKLRATGYAGFADAPVDVQAKLFVESADEVLAETQAGIAAGEPVGVETVLSSSKYRPLVEEVRAADGFVGLIYVALSSPIIARERVATRVRRGGHGVPDEKVDQRWRRSLDCLGWFAERATAFWVVDNSDSDPSRPPELVAAGKTGSLEFLSERAFPELRAALGGLPR